MVYDIQENIYGMQLLYLIYVLINRLHVNDITELERLLISVNIRQIIK